MIPPSILRLHAEIKGGTRRGVVCDTCRAHTTIHEIFKDRRRYLWLGCEFCGAGTTYIADTAPMRPPGPEEEKPARERETRHHRR